MEAVGGSTLTASSLARGINTPGTAGGESVSSLFNAD